jgi:hypothetical protein
MPDPDEKIDTALAKLDEILQILKDEKEASKS